MADLEYTTNEVLEILDLFDPWEKVTPLVESLYNLLDKTQADIENGTNVNQERTITIKIKK